MDIIDNIGLKYIQFLFNVWWMLVYISNQPSYIKVSDMYQIYQGFLKNSEHRQTIIDEIRREEARYNYRYYSEQIVWKELVDKFAEYILDDDDAPQESMYLDSCILKDFPLSEQLALLEPWVNDPYFWCWGSMMYEVMKMVYFIAPVYLKMHWKHPPRTYPHAEFFRCFDAMRQNLLSLLNIKDIDAFRAAQKTRYRHVRCKYLHFTHMAILPLLVEDNKGLLILEHVATKLPYGDAEEGMCFAMAHFDINNKEVLAVMRRIFTSWNSDDSLIGFSTSRGDLSHVIIEWQRRLHFNALHDPVMGPIIIERNIMPV